MIPAVVEKSDIVHANDLINSTNYGVMGIGYGLGGFLILRAWGSRRLLASTWHCSCSLRCW